MLNLELNSDYEGFPAAQVLAMAFFRQNGMIDIIDEAADPDVRRILTPGNAVCAFVGAMFDGRGRSALYMMRRKYASAPVDLMFGRRVRHESMNDAAFGRNLDLLYTLDLDRLHHALYRRICERHSLTSDLFHIDVTNYTVNVKAVREAPPGCAVPEFCGHAKDGRNDRRVYSLLSIADSNGVICYERPYSGSVSDGEMDRNAVIFLSGATNPRETVLVADNKIVTRPLIALMESFGFGFVSKCPAGFGGEIRDGIVYSAIAGGMDPCGAKEGWEVYDTDAEVGGRTLRFVAYRFAGTVEEGVEWHRTHDEARSKALFSGFGSRLFSCREDAERAFREAEGDNADSAYVASCAIEEVRTLLNGRRDRRPKGWKPEYGTEYRVKAALSFDEGGATAAGEFMAYVEALGLDPDRLLC